MQVRQANLSQVDNQPSTAELPEMPDFPSGKRTPEVIADYNNRMRDWYADFRIALQRELDKIQN